MINTSSVNQLSLPRVLRDYELRLQALEGQVGRWIYLLPMAPGTPPQDFNAADPLSPTFQNSFTNTAGQQPISFRIHPATKIEIRGVLSGGSGTLPLVVFTLPANYRPTEGAVYTTFPGIDGVATYSARIDTDGDVWLLGRVT